MSSNNNTTVKYTQVNPKLITAAKVKMGKDIVPLVRYNGDSSLTIQLPWMTLSQYGLPAGEKLQNGEINEYYNGEENRHSIKIPLDVSQPEMNEVIEKIQAIDKHIQNSEQIRQIYDIDEDNLSKYKGIFRKPGKSKKKKGAEESKKDKMNFIKIKLDTDYASKQIKTKFYLMDEDNKPQELNDTTTAKELEKYIVYNTQIRPIIRLVNIWESSSSGEWGPNIKLIKAQIRVPERKAKEDNTDFLDDEDAVKNSNAFLDDEDDKSKKSKKVTAEVASDSDSDDDKPTVKTTTKKPVAQVESDDDSSDEDKPAPPKKVSKGATKKPIAQVESDDDSSDGSDSDVQVNNKKIIKKAASDSESDDDSDEETTKAKIQPKGKMIKKAAESSDDDSESEPETKPKTQTKGKAVKKIASEADDDDEDKPAPKKGGKATRGGKARSSNA